MDGLMEYCWMNIYIDGWIDISINRYIPVRTWPKTV